MSDMTYPEKVRRQIIEENDKEKLWEDLEHFYFCGIGILTCSLSNWQSAIIAAGVVVCIRELFRWQARRKEFGDE